MSIGRSLSKLVVCILMFESACKECGKIKWAFESTKIVPDVINISPPQQIQISFENDVSVNLGNELTPSQVIEEPFEIQWTTEPDTLYTLIFTDPDAPRSQSTDDLSMREFIHWLVVNIPGNAVENGEHLVQYMGSGPGQGNVNHRYTFLAFQQLQGVINPESPKATNDSIEERVFFNTRAFAEKYQLGQPIAGNFYRA